MSSWNEPDFRLLPIMLVGSIVRHGRGGTYIACDDERDSSDGVCRDLVMLLRSHSGVLIVCCETCCETKHPCCESLDMCSSNAYRTYYRLSISFIIPAILSPFLATK
jgi:hypothetical protein